MNKEKEKLWLCSFEEMWFNFPIPFKVGDIVCDCYNRKPFVLKGTVPWYKKENPPIQKDWMDFMTHADMKAVGYTYNADTVSLSDECSSDFMYLNLEYYRGNLTGGERLLKAYSLYEKEVIDSYTLLKLNRMIVAETVADRERKVLQGYINLEQFGLEM
jgi:hypothetical protein